MRAAPSSTSRVLKESRYNREIIREFSPTWQAMTTSLQQDPPRRFLLPRAEAKQVILALSDNLKVDQHLVDVQVCKFPLHTFDKPTLPSAAALDRPVPAPRQQLRPPLVSCAPIPLVRVAPGQLSDPWKCERPTGSPAFFTCSRAPGTTRREAALCYAARNGGRTRCRSRCGENDAHSSPSSLIDTAGSREPASSAVGRRRASKFSH